jgi:arylsulfatase A-like enzyme
MTHRPNILLLTVDSLRADHLSSYGYHFSTSPFLDAFAEDGVLCEQLICSAIPTHPSYTTILTGQHPIRHNIVAHGGSIELARNIPMLPEILLRAGYRTCAVDNLWRQRLWFGRGFEFVIDPSVRHNLLIRVGCEDLNEPAIHWLKHHAKEPFFMHVHYWDPHYPYVPPKGYRDLFYENGNPTDPNIDTLKDWWQHPMGALAKDTWLRSENGLITDPDYVISLYDQEIRYLDDGVRQIITAVDRLGLAEKTLIVVTADHGESLTEHGIFFDHYGLYETTLHVPLLFRWPGIIPKGLRLPQLLTTSDITPTILEAVGLASPKVCDGDSFWHLLNGDKGKHIHDRVVSLECTWQAKWALRTSRYKFILARQPDQHGSPMQELYDMVSDPKEQTNVVTQHPIVASELRHELEAWISDQLRALGKERDPLLEQGASMRPA